MKEILFCIKTVEVVLPLHVGNREMGFVFLNIF